MYNIPIYELNSRVHTKQVVWVITESLKNVTFCCAEIKL